MKIIKSPNPGFAVFIATIFGFLFGYCLFFYDGGINTQICSELVKGPVFNKVPSFLTFATSYIILSGTSAAIGIILINVINTIKQEFEISNKQVAGAQLMVLLMCIVASVFILRIYSGGVDGGYKPPVSPLLHQDLKVGILFALGALISSAGVTGIILAGKVTFKLNHAEITEESVATYFKLKRHIDNLLFLSGFVLSSGSVILYFLYESANTISTEKLYDPQIAIIFGLIFSLFIASGYLPAKVLLNAYGGRIVNKYIGGLPIKDETGLDKWFKSRDSIEKYLQIQ